MNKENNKKILDLIFSSIISEGGDGDALWLSKFTPIEELLKLIEEYNIENNTNWEVKREKNYLLWGINQEWAIITDDNEFFNSQPDWIILKINY
jgi:hypothetical protein